jgi:hypothetical protein
MLSLQFRFDGTAPFMVALLIDGDISATISIPSLPAEAGSWEMSWLFCWLTCARLHTLRHLSRCAAFRW